MSDKQTDEVWVDVSTIGDGEAIDEREIEIGWAEEMYVRGLIDVHELERRVEQALHE